MRKERDLHSVYIVLTYGVFSSKEISANAKMILGEIISLMKAERPFVFASNDHFARLFGLNKATASYHINKLKETNYIDAEIFKNGCDDPNCPVKNRENHRHIYPTNKLLTLLERFDTLSSRTRYSYQATLDTPYQVKPTIEIQGDKNNKVDSTGETKSFPREDYNLILDAYQRCKGIKLSGPEFLIPQRAIKEMFKADRKPSEIIRFMEWLRENEHNDKMPWVGTWTIWTVQKKIAEFVAGKLKTNTLEEELPRYG